MHLSLRLYVTPIKCYYPISGLLFPPFNNMALNVWFHFLKSSGVKQVVFGLSHSNYAAVPLHVSALVRWLGLVSIRASGGFGGDTPVWDASVLTWNIPQLSVNDRHSVICHVLSLSQLPREKSLWGFVGFCWQFGLPSGSLELESGMVSRPF